MIAHTPGLIALLFRVGDLVGLAVDAWLHDMVTADGTVVHVDVPGPEGDRVPFFHFKATSWGSFYHFGL